MSDTQPELTPKQQELMNFLSQLTTTPLTRETLAEGNQLLDAAADECREQQEALRQQQVNQPQQFN
jgi:hypothetical protein